MRIDLNFGSLESMQSGSAKRAGEAAKELRTTFKQDEAVLSKAGATVSTLATRALSAPELRMDRVAELRTAINNGSYNVDSRSIANAILNDLF